MVSRAVKLVLVTVTSGALAVGQAQDQSGARPPVSCGQIAFVTVMRLMKVGATASDYLPPAALDGSTSIGELTHSLQQAGLWADPQRLSPQELLKSERSFAICLVAVDWSPKNQNHFVVVDLRPAADGGQPRIIDPTVPSYWESWWTWQRFLRCWSGPAILVSDASPRPRTSIDLLVFAGGSVVSMGALAYRRRRAHAYAK